MAARSRTKSAIQPVKGYGERMIAGSLVTLNRSEVLGLKSKCDDVVDGTRNPHGLTIRHDECHVEGLNGEVVINSTNWSKYYDKRPTWAQTIGTSGASSYLDAAPSNNSIALTTQQRSNPSRAEVDMGVAIAELREAPQLLYRAGRSMLQNGANYFLSYQFGWSPLVNDALDCLDVPRSYSRRLSEMQALYRKGGLRRRIDLPTQRATSVQSNYIFESEQGQTISGQIRNSSVRKCWGVARWRPTVDGLPTDPGDMERLMRRTLYGLHVDASTAWNLIPWSWLIDWFGTFGDYLDANRDTVGATLNGPICVMKHTTHFSEYVRYNTFPTITGGNGYKRTEIKERSLVPFTLPEARFPLLGGTRLSILGSLAVLRIPENLLARVEVARF